MIMSFVKSFATVVVIGIGIAAILVAGVFLWWALAARCTPFGPSWWC